LADALVEEALAACVTRLPGVCSTYRWQNKIQHESEQLLFIKTTTRRFAAMRTRLLQLHPYELPELIAVEIQHGHAAYLEWIRANVAATPADDASASRGSFGGDATIDAATCYHHGSLCGAGSRSCPPSATSP
jgi:periplasmic divalent cation tolerance protein